MNLQPRYSEAPVLVAVLSVCGTEEPPQLTRQAPWLSCRDPQYGGSELTLFKTPCPHYTYIAIY